MARVTFLGVGAMGSRMAINLLKAGHELTVWNRTPEVAAPLVDAGARQAFTPRDAVASAEVIIAMLRDDGASREVWLNPESGALAGMPPSAIAIESSTLTSACAGLITNKLADKAIKIAKIRDTMGTHGG